MATAGLLPFDPVLDALEAPIVQAMAPERRAGLERDLRAMAARDVSDEAMLREAIARRLQQEAEIDEEESLSPEELAELEQEAEEAEEDVRAGRGIPVEQVFAALGMAYPPARAG
jgi:hypothetical protein